MCPVLQFVEVCGKVSNKGGGLKIQQVEAGSVC